MAREAESAAGEIEGSTVSIKVRAGRTKRDGKDYTIFRRELWRLQYGNCVTCGKPTSLEADLEMDWSFHVDHKAGRGLGGSKRDDSFDDCEGLCGLHHRVKHGQQSAVPSKLQWSRSNR